MALRVGDRLRAPHVCGLARLDELVDAVSVLGPQLPELGCDLDQGHARRGRARRDVAVPQRLHSAVHVLARTRHEVHRMERCRVWVVEAVVGRGDRVDGGREQRVCRRVVDPLAVDVATPTIDERRAVLIPGHHRHRGSPQSTRRLGGAIVLSGWSLQVLPRPHRCSSPRARTRRSRTHDSTPPRSAGPDISSTST